MKTCTLKMIATDKIIPNPENPRKTFAAEDLAELTASIAAVGVLQPLLVRPAGKGKGFLLVAGERRLRAALAAGLAEVPCQVQRLDEREALEAAIAENEQRVDVTLSEKAEGYHLLMTQHGASLEEIAERIGKSKSTVRNLLKLRLLPERSRSALAAGVLSPSLAGLIGSRPTEEQRQAVEDFVFRRGPEDLPTILDVKDWIEENQTVQLKGAPFKTTDKTLPPLYMSCKECPKRAGNMPELENVRADVCTDPTCYREKVVAHAKRVVDKAAAAGRPTLKDDVIEKIFAFGTSVDEGSGFIDWQGPCYSVAGKEGELYCVLFADFVGADHIAVVVDPEGKTREVVRREVIDQVAKHFFPAAKVKKTTSPKNVSKLVADQAAKRLQEEDELRREVDAICQRVAAGSETAEVPRFTEQVLRIVARDIFVNAWPIVRDELYRSRGLDQIPLGQASEAVHAQITYLDISGLVLFLAEVSALSYVYSHNPADAEEAKRWFV